MNREQFAERVHALRNEGKSIRTIAREIGTYKTKVQRTLKELAEHPQFRAPARQIIPGTFVGRQGEMNELRATFEDVSLGRARIVMLSGEPGIGKTRIAEEFAFYTSSRGVKSVWGRCYEAPGAPPYWPWIQIIRSCIKDQDPEQISSALGNGAAAIAEVVPEVRVALPDLEPVPRLEPEQARFRLFDSITTFLKNISKDHPLVLLMDNLHWADRSSILLLEFLSQELSDSRICLIGTYRDIEITQQHPLSHTLGELIKQPHFQRISLKGLDHENIDDLIRQISGATPPKTLVETVYRRTEGNPLFVTEVVRMLDKEGTLTQKPIEGHRDFDLRIPDGAREAIGRRLHGLSNDCTRFLTVASVIGREFSLELMKRLIPDLIGERLAETLDEGLSTHIIEEMPEEVGRYQFTHVLIQESLSMELPTARKAPLHAEIGGVLEALYEREIEAHADELAHHFNESEGVLGTEKLAHYSLIAGERALATHAYEEALTHFERGLVARDIALSGTQAASDKEVADLLFGFARSQAAISAQHQGLRPFATLRRAFEYYAEAGNVTLAVAAAEFPIAPPPARIPGVAQIVARALSLVPPDSHEAGRLLSRYGGILGAADCDYEGAQKALGRAISIARREGDVPLEVQTLAYATDVSGNHLRWQESVDNGLRAIKLAAGNENTYSEVLPRFWTSLSLLHMGDLRGARPHTLVLRDVAERRSTPRLLAGIGYLPTISIACLEGDWQAGREASDRCLEVEPLAQQLIMPRVLLEYETGEFAQGEAYMERLIEAYRIRPNLFFSTARMSMVITAVARISGVPARLEIAEAAAESVLSDQSVTPLLVMNAKAGLALLAVQKGDRIAAKDHYGHLLGQKGTMIWTILSVDRLLGLLSQTVGDLEQASAHFEDALAFCRRAGYRPELAWTCCDYAECLLQATTDSGRTEAGESRKAKDLLDEALAISGVLGMGPLMERVVALQERTEVPLVPSRAYFNGLTLREVEVLQLIARGKTTREIANDLVLSPRTVQRHTSNIYAKINARNRADATAFLLHELSASTQIISPGK